VFIRKADDANEGIFGVMARFSRRLCQVDYEVSPVGLCFLSLSTLAPPPHMHPTPSLSPIAVPFAPSPHSFPTYLAPPPPPSVAVQLWAHLRDTQILPEYYSFRWLTTLLTR
jgi:hypothetical protein